MCVYWSWLYWISRVFLIPTSCVTKGLSRNYTPLKRIGSLQLFLSVVLVKAATLVTANKFVWIYYPLLSGWKGDKRPFWGKWESRLGWSCAKLLYPLRMLLFMLPEWHFEHSAPEYNNSYIHIQEQAQTQNTILDLDFSDRRTHVLPSYFYMFTCQDGTGKLKKM